MVKIDNMSTKKCVKTYFAGQLFNEIVSRNITWLKSTI